MNELNNRSGSKLEHGSEGLTKNADGQAKKGNYIRKVRRHREWSKKSNEHQIQVPEVEDKMNGRKVTCEASAIDVSLRSNKII